MLVVAGNIPPAKAHDKAQHTFTTVPQQISNHALTAHPMRAVCMLCSKDDSIRNGK